MNINETSEHLSGTIERIVYHNPETNFCVLRVIVQGHKDLVTVTGNTPSITTGEYIKCSGTWHNDRNYGKQFKTHCLQTLPPNNLEGIEKYLSSGLIKGIGKLFAKRLIAAFGTQVFAVIEHRPDLLSTVEGIGQVRAQSICDHWQDQKIIREIMIFLQSHGVSTARAARIYKTYGAQAIEIVTNNPYQLAQDIRGIGFTSADTIATNLGIAKNSLIRARAGIVHVLLESASNGHCGLPKEILVQKSQTLLEIDADLVELALAAEIKSRSLVTSTLDNNISVFLSSYYTCEQNIAKLLLGLAKTAAPWSVANIAASIPMIEKQLSIQLAPSQKLALSKALTNKVTVITGGPGTGKTTLVNTLLKILSTNNLTIKLCAPTGRAAKRLSESTGLAATTIHRLLEIQQMHGVFKYNEELPLSCDYLVVDETSMVDIWLFYSILRALPRHAGLLLVGDVDQLSSVGAGQVLKDIIDSGIITTVQLTQVFRQSATSSIITTAHSVNKGIIPNLNSTPDSDFYFIAAEPGDDMIAKIITMVKDRIPKRFHLNPVTDIQLLCPMQRGGTGARSLNIELQKILNPNYSTGIARFGQLFATGDKVMQTENNYDKETYNGDIGIIRAIDPQEQTITINFYTRDVTYDYDDLDQVTLAYATTIHKSQGSEYPAVIIPLTMQSYMMLRRNLIYTGITRGKQLVVVIGQKKALAMAIKDNTSSSRYSKLKEWLLLL